MFQTVREYQSRSIKGRSSTTTSSAQLVRRNLRVAGLISMPNSGKSPSPVCNDVELPSRWTLTKEHLRRELWSYMGLLGLFSIYFGILVCVYALKGVFAQRGVMTFCGVSLTGLGGMNLFISWMCYRCQKKHRKFSLCCGDGDQYTAPPSPPPPKTRPRGQSLAGFLTPEFAKYAEFSARDRRYDNKRHNFFRAYDPAHISISFAHRYWLEQQKPLLQTGFGSPSLLPSFPASPRNLRTPRSTEPKRKLLDKDHVSKRRQLST